MTPEYRKRQWHHNHSFHPCHCTFDTHTYQNWQEKLRGFCSVWANVICRMLSERLRGAVCHCRTTCLPPHYYSGGEIFYTWLFLLPVEFQSPSAAAVIKDGSDTHQQCHSPYSSAMTCAGWHTLRSAHIHTPLTLPAHCRRFNVSSLCSRQLPLSDMHPRYFSELTWLASVHGRRLPSLTASLTNISIQHTGRKLLAIKGHIQLCLCQTSLLDT